MKKLIYILSLVFLTSSLFAQETETSAPEKDSGAQAGAKASQADKVPTTKPLFLFYSDKEGRYMRPILQIAGGATHWQATTRRKTDLKEQPFNTTVAITRFGFEGRASKLITFHSEFERNLGVNSTAELGGGEVVGSGVWEGTAAFSVRDNYLKAATHGFSVAAGIVTDPASSDFFSMHLTDLLLSDPAVRDTLLFSGFNRSQGILAQYNFQELIKQDLTLGFMFNAGNPLSTSTSLSFGGQINSVEGIFSNAVRNKGQTEVPGDTVTVETMSPSIIYKVWLLETRLGAQLHQVNTDRFSEDDANLGGTTLRGALAFQLFSNKIVPFVNYAQTENETAFIGKDGNFGPTEFDPGKKGENFKSRTMSAGMDINFGGWLGWDPRDGIGGNYAIYEHEKYKSFSNKIVYLNAGMTKWISQQASVGLRYSRIVWEQKRKKKLFDEVDTNALFLTMRLLL